MVCFTDYIMSKLGIKLKIALFGLLTLAGGAGLVWIANLPYPMIRRPIAKVAPIILLPSYINMDHNYREAIANVEQADQLVNKATSRADIELGQEKVNLAQANLDQLPVWFLGYEPKFYCSLFGCAWKFTFDEFETARKQIGRMDAVIFQEVNALNQLDIAESAIASAKENYQKTENKNQALQDWQNALDKLMELPDNTLAKKMTANKLPAYERDFQQVSGIVKGSDRTLTRIAVAKEFATSAMELCKNPPHLTITWQECSNLWQQSLDHLKSIPLEDTGYLEAQKLLANYTTNLAKIKIQEKKETESLEYLNQAEKGVETLLKSNNNQPNYIVSQLQAIINDLDKVQPETTAYQKSQELQKFAKEKLKQFQ